MTSSLARRLANRRAESTQKLIVFHIRQIGFTLPIQAVEKVIPLGQVYGAPDGQGLKFTRYQDRQILVVDAKERIFRGQEPEARQISQQSRIYTQPSTLSEPENSDLGTISSAHLLIIQNAEGESIGIPLDSQPSLRRAPISAFKPLPSAYLSDGKIRCISALVVLGEEPPLFLLNLDQLLAVSTRSLPSSF